MNFKDLELNKLPPTDLEKQAVAENNRFLANRYSQANVAARLKIIEEEAAAIRAIRATRGEEAPQEAPIL
jgi:hypothetical protein